MGRSGKHYIEGYPSLAAFIASDPDKTTLIFKRFDRLAARNLLHLQSELARLQAEQDGLDEQASQEDLHSKQCLRNWEDFKKAVETDPKQQRRHDLALEIRKTMKEYREALIFESTLAHLKPPTERTWKAFQIRFFHGKKGEEELYPTLGGNSSSIFYDRDDLVALKVPEEQDRLTSFAQNHLSFLFQDGPSDGNIAYISDQRISHFVAWVSVLIAAVLLIGAILSLYFIQSPGWRLGSIAAFTVAFAAGVGLLTSARRQEIFAATAAYAAVLVVFVSGNLGSNNPPIGIVLSP